MVDKHVQMLQKNIYKTFHNAPDAREISINILCIPQTELNLNTQINNSDKVQ